MIFWLVLKLEMSYRVIIIRKILVSFRGFFEDYILAWWNIWVFIILLFCLKILFNLNGQGHSVTHPLLLCFTLLVVHDAEELKLSLLSTLQKQTNKQTNKQHQQGFCMDLPSMKYNKRSSLKLTPHKPNDAWKKFTTHTEFLYWWER